MSSGNKVIDDFLRYTLSKKISLKRMEFVPYNRFKDVELIAEGEFSKIYKTTWIDGPMSHFRNYFTVALKELDDFKNIKPEELRTMRRILYIRYNNNKIFNSYYGITQNPITQNFVIIMNYYESGNLTCYITNDFYNISWFNKLCKLVYIMTGLVKTHSSQIIHESFHSGNIFFTDKSAIINDFGINKSSFDKNKIYGIIPYVAPEVFEGKCYNKASNIYSLGMIMWELMTGRRPFWDQSHDADLINKIIDGFRPPITTNAPEGYIELMKECWNSDPKIRPGSGEVSKRIFKICIKEYDNRTKITKSSDIGPVTIDNPGAIYQIRYLGDIIEAATSSKNLKGGHIILEINKRKYEESGFDNVVEDNNDEVFNYGNIFIS
ncbi:kinase-like domain-containing protein [Glomus cerebriforme]|uniref:Kinase-like domain-containing protein n=1 Tax=Glomus cerebriforme TaxID=658196 RepID=A0A397SRS7_9GLOM|nr:kinase-like domain-containing protein [Glomus cerebriforme]